MLYRPFSSLTVTMVNIISTILVGKTLKESLKTYLLRGKQLSEDEVSALKDCLCRKTLQELRVIAKDVNVRLAGSSRK